jgi:hypothetical protein
MTTATPLNGVDVSLQGAGLVNVREMLESLRSYRRGKDDRNDSDDD